MDFSRISSFFSIDSEEEGAGKRDAVQRRRHRDAGVEHSTETAHRSPENTGRKKRSGPSTLTISSGSCTIDASSSKNVTSTRAQMKANGGLRRTRSPDSYAGMDQTTDADEEVARHTEKLPYFFTDTVGLLKELRTSDPLYDVGREISSCSDDESVVSVDMMSDNSDSLVTKLRNVPNPQPNGHASAKNRGPYQAESIAKEADSGSTDTKKSSKQTRRMNDLSPVPMQSPEDEERGDFSVELVKVRAVPQKRKKHTRMFAHGKRWTLLALVAAWAGVALSVTSRSSLEFATLETPLVLPTPLLPVKSVGMIYMRVCFNESFAIDTGCESIELHAHDIDDNVFELARSLMTLATIFGGFFSLMLSSAVYWESINLRPLGVGFLLTYFFQSFSMLFFDTTVCSVYTCKVGTGCILCIVSSFFWIAACVGTAKMDAFKLRDRRRRRRLDRTKTKEAMLRQKKELLKRKTSYITSVTTNSSSSHSSDEDLEFRGECAPVRSSLEVEV